MNAASVTQQSFLDKFRGQARSILVHLKIFSGLGLQSIVGVVGLGALASSEKKERVLNVSCTKQSIKSCYKTYRAQTYLGWLDS